MKWCFLFGLVLLFACQQRNDKTIHAPLTARISKKDSIKIADKKAALLDSIKQDSVLSTVFKYSLQHKSEKYFKKQTSNADSTENLEYIFGNLFSSDKKHLIVKNDFNHEDVYLNVFVLNGNKFERVVNDTLWTSEGPSYKLKDVNGDHKKDFLINWYGVSGCCARNRFNVYLYNAQSGHFYGKYDFINPTFFAPEKIIRGVEYGHPGEVPLYKYRWNGAHVDTVEYIYPADTLHAKFYLVHRYGDNDYPSRRKVLLSVPKEYYCIDGYTWFTDY